MSARRPATEAKLLRKQVADAEAASKAEVSADVINVIGTLKAMINRYVQASGVSRDHNDVKKTKWIVYRDVISAARRIRGELIRSIATQEQRRAELSEAARYIADINDDNYSVHREAFRQAHERNILEMPMAADAA